MEGMVSIPSCCFNNTNELAPKVEIWSEEKLTFLSKSDCILESFEGNGIPERLNALLSSLESRQEFSFLKSFNFKNSLHRSSQRFLTHFSIFLFFQYLQELYNMSKCHFSYRVYIDLFYRANRRMDLYKSMARPTYHPYKLLLCIADHHYHTALLCHLIFQE